MDETGKVTALILFILALFATCWALGQPDTPKGGAYERATERDFQKAHHWGKMEHRLKDGTRVDDLTSDFAIEYDFAKKWAEAVGQSLHYSRLTGKRAGIVIILQSDTDAPKVDNILKLKLPITVWTVKNLREEPVRIN